jgi:hypothetical protein
MAHLWIAALGMIAAAQPMPAQQPEPGAAAPAAGAGARYCLRVEPVTGSRVEFVRCWTRQAWAEQGVDVDREWAKEGVTVLR